MAEGNLDPFDFLDLLYEHPCQDVAACDDANKRDVLRAVVRFQDLVRDAHKRTFDFRSIHAYGFRLLVSVHTHSFH